MAESDLIVNGQDFLLLRYKEADFFINRCQFSSSAPLDKIQNIKTSTPFFSGVFSYSGNKVLLFDYNAFLGKYFRCQPESESRLCLLMKLGDFTEKGGKKIKSVLERNKQISKDYLGLIITSQAEIKPIAFEEIRLAPAKLRQALFEKGLCGCRFNVEDRIQYFVDLETGIMDIIYGRLS